MSVWLCWQLTTLPSLERSLAPLGAEEGLETGLAAGGALPGAALVQARAEAVTRAISELWAAARDLHPRLAPRGHAIRHAVRALLALFPQVPLLGVLLLPLESVTRDSNKITEGLIGKTKPSLHLSQESTKH